MSIVVVAVAVAVVGGDCANVVAAAAAVGMTMMTTIKMKAVNDVLLALRTFCHPSGVVGVKIPSRFHLLRIRMQPLEHARTHRSENAYRSKNASFSLAQQTPTDNSAVFVCPFSFLFVFVSFCIEDGFKNYHKIIFIFLPFALFH